MNKLILIIAVFLLFESTGFTDDYTQQQIGNFKYTNGSNGYSGTSQQIGNFNYYQDNQGNSYTTHRIGNTLYTNGTNGYSSTTQQSGIG